MNSKRRLLISLAHPDDESFGMAGTIARYANEDVEVHLIISTNGDVGEVAPEYLEGYASIAEKRLAELECATQTLGVTRLYTFGYRDSGMPGTPDNDHPDSLFSAGVDTVAERIADIIRKVRPHVVVTFDPFGGYGHPDHIVMHQATVRAFDMLSEQLKGEPDQPQKLYFMTFDRRWLKLVVRVLPLFGQNPSQWGRNKDIDLREIAAHSYPIHARLDNRPYAHVAEQARLCHASQLPGGESPKRVGQIIQSWLFGTEETYMRAYPPVNGGRVRERDLFEGVVLD